jgi:hypothetical protein
MFVDGGVDSQSIMVMVVFESIMVMVTFESIMVMVESLLSSSQV